MKYTEEMVKAIVELKETTDHTTENICKTVGIHKDTYYDWLKTKPDFSDAIKAADAKRLETMKQLAREMAFKKLTGYTVEEEKVEQERKLVEVEEGGVKKSVYRPVVKSITKTKKHITGSDTLIMYLLNNTDKDNFKHASHVDHTSKGGKVAGFDFTGMSTEDIVARAKAVEQLEKDSEKKS